MSVLRSFLPSDFCSQAKVTCFLFVNWAFLTEGTTAYKTYFTLTVNLHLFLSTFEAGNKRCGCWIFQVRSLFWLLGGTSTLWHVLRSKNLKYKLCFVHVTWKKSQQLLFLFRKCVDKLTFKYSYKKQWESSFFTQGGAVHKDDFCLNLIDWFMRKRKNKIK